MNKPSDKFKVAFVSGASGGIGSAIADTLANAGYAVAVGYNKNKEAAQQVCARIAASGGLACPIGFDYAERDSIRSALHSAKMHYSEAVSILINNGAIAQEKSFEDISDEDWSQMQRINLQGPFIAAQECLPAMRDRGWGRIINISSIGGQWGGFNQVHYAAAKAGLINLTQSLARLYSTQGVASMALAIGLVATRMTENEISSDRGRAKLATIPCGRLGDPGEIAAMVAFLCSDAAAYLSGQTLNANGGMLFH